MMFYVYVVYYLIMNVTAFVLYGVDKKRAIKRRWRIPESVLLGIAFLGGAPGAFLAMRVYRHKTLHAIFSIGVPLMIVLHVILGILLYRWGFFPVFSN